MLKFKKNQCQISKFLKVVYQGPICEDNNNH